jgi:neutral ceramidase
MVNNAEAVLGGADIRVCPACRCLKGRQECLPHLTRRRFAVGALAGAAALSVGARKVMAGEKSAPTLLAGAAETTVTPPAKGTFLIGPMKPSTGVYDDLWARALVLAQGDRRVALLTLDYLGFDFAYNDLLLDAVSRATGIPPRHILINCAHNHNAPLTIPWGQWEKNKDKPYHKMLPERLADIAKRACDGLQPARIGYKREPVQVGFNRRLPTDKGIVMAPNRSGAALPWVDVLRIEGHNGKRIAVLMSHAAHPVIVHEASTLITADYPGFAVAALRKLQGDSGVCMFAQGCGGNINGFPLQGGIDAAAAAGRDLANAADRALRSPGDSADGGQLKVASCDLSLPLASPPPVAECEKMLAAEKDGVRKQQLTELLDIARGGQPQTKQLRIRAFALGDQLCVLGFSHEMFAEYGQFVEQVSPFAHNVVLAYTNGVECYVGTEKDYLLGDRGGYETSPMGAALRYNGRLPLAPQAERQIKAGIVRLLNRLKSA